MGMYAVGVIIHNDQQNAIRKSGKVTAKGKIK